MDNALKQAILSVDDLKREKMTIEEWQGMEVWVRELNGTERAEIESEAISLFKLHKGNDTAAQKPLKLKLLTYGLCDKDGAKLFTEDDIDALGKKNGKVIERLAEAIMKLSAMDEDAEETELGNSQSDQGGG